MAIKHLETGLLISLWTYMGNLEKEPPTFGDQAAPIHHLATSRTFLFSYCFFILSSVSPFMIQDVSLVANDFL